MIEPDTIRLLRECDAGVRMGTAAIGDVLPRTTQPPLRQALANCKHAQEALGAEITAQLHRYQDAGKQPNSMARSMSWLKTNLSLALDDADHTIADLMTDGCNMGVKSLSKYLNQYAAADESSKALCRRLIEAEEALAVRLRDFL